MLKFAIVGLGGLGKVHLTNMESLVKQRDDVDLVALCDVEESRFYEKTDTNLGSDSAERDLSQYRLYTDVEEMFEKEELDFVVTALPSYLHAKIAIMALNRGLHVFSEKPMALSLEDCRSMVDAAKKNDRRLMIGQCLRFWPEYVKLKEYIDSKEFGRVVRAEFGRQSPTPEWSWQNWMLDEAKSGGAAMDLHVHDVDFIQWAFGTPEKLSSAATHVKTKFDSIFTTYCYKDFIVTSACDWGLSKTSPFKMWFLVRFEKATVMMDSQNGMVVYTDEQGEIKPELTPAGPYYEEINDLVNCIKEGRESKISTAESVMQSTKIALLEKESALKGEMVYVS